MFRFFIVLISVLFNVSFAEAVSSTYSPVDHILAGETLLRKTILKAQEDLQRRGVKSRASPGELVSSYVPEVLVRRLVAVENLSQEDFYSGKLPWLYRRIGKYGYKHFAYAESPMGARGILQITKPTFEFISAIYKNTGLGKNFERVVTDPVASAKVAILFVDSALAALSPEERVRVLESDITLNDYVAASYNGGINFAVRTLRRGGDFTGCNKSETREYVAKMREARTAVKKA